MRPVTQEEKHEAATVSLLDSDRSPANSAQPVWPPERNARLCERPMDNVVVLELAEDPESFLDWATKEIRLRAGWIAGDSSGGRFGIILPLGLVTGEYRVLQRQLTLTVTNRPFLISASDLKRQLMKILRQRVPAATDGATPITEADG